MGVVKNLVQSLDRWGLSYDIEFWDLRGKWIENCNKKPEFIIRKMCEHKTDIVWLDADAVVQEYPIYFDVLREDIGVCYEDFAQALPEKLQSGTLYFKRNSRVVHTLNTWRKRGEKHSNLLDQRLLRDTLLGEHFQAHKISLFFFPQSYYHIFDIMEDWGKPVIEHFQASRKYRRGNG